MVASGSSNGSIDIWDTETHDLLQTFTARGDLRSIGFSPDNKTIVSVSASVSASEMVLGKEYVNLAVELWEIATGQCEQTFKTRFEHTWGWYVLPTALSKDTKVVAFGQLNEIILWNPTSQFWQTLRSHGRYTAVTNVAFSPDGKMVAAGYGAGDNTIKLWNIQGSLQRSRERHQSAQINHKSLGTVHHKLQKARSQSLPSPQEILRPSRIKISPDGKSVASIHSPTSLCTLKFWDTSTCKLQKFTRLDLGFADTNWPLRFSADGNKLFYGTWGHIISRRKTMMYLFQRIFGTNSSKSQPARELDKYSFIFTDFFDIIVSLLDSPSAFWGRAHGSSRALSSSAENSRSIREPGSLYFNDDGSWLMRDGETLLWLPIDYRTHVADIRGSSIVIGLNEGNIVIISFDFSSGIFT
ncbi:hypothetical protein ABW21_db0203481 [Orbilia brochopaga]|nr:hypothetical protein ABW21_db0203481 [Drechslerella brochopaga]